MNKFEYVDPLIGSVGEVDDNEACHGGGKVHPGACVPGGLVQLSPDTITAGDNGTGYSYTNNTIEGFSFNHMSGIGWYGDLGNLQLMPVVGDTDLRSGTNAEVPFNKGTLGWRSPFSHENECAKAGYYSVLLDRYNIKAEATVSERTGMLRVTYPENSDARVIFNLSRRIGGHADFQHIEAIDKTTFKGYIKCTPAGGGFGRGHGNISYTLYFYMKLSQTPENIKFFENEEFVDASSCYEGEDVGMLAFFGNLSEPLIISVGLSYTDLEGAQKNFEAENTDFDFDKMRSAAEQKWENVFSCVDVEGTDETDLTLFYTCLYHTLLDPRIMADTDGRYKSADGKIHQSTYTQRTMFSGWDVYRSEFPLLTVIRPDIVNDTVNSMLNIALEKNSSMPKWELMGIDAGCMVGDPSLIVTADAFVKGIRNFDVEKAYAVSRASSTCAKELFGKEFHSVRPEDFKYTDIYLKDAYVPYRLSLSLELLMADYSMHKFAQALGKEDDAKYFADRAARYKENYDRHLGFLAPRDENGDFLFLEEGLYDTDGCVESNILQQTWFIPYDVEGLCCELFGKERAINLLEKFFDKADLSALWNDDYNHSNEPCHNITHYFNILGLPHRTQYWTRRVQKESYRLGPFGFCGNEDVGQLSAWYVLSALGFAQICPAEPIYQLNTPLFKKAEIKLSKEYHSCKTADTLEIVCDKNPLDYPYIKEVFLNGNKISSTFVTYEDITNGGKLEFILSEKPC